MWSVLYPAAGRIRQCMTALMYACDCYQGLSEAESHTLCLSALGWYYYVDIFKSGETLYTGIPEAGLKTQLRR